MTDIRQLLQHCTSISIAREGGVAFMPGLSAPRRIQLTDLSPRMRQGLQRALNGVAGQACAPMGRGDQRYFTVTFHPSRTSGEIEQTVHISEQAGAEAIANLWEQAAEHK